ncbi:MAG: hypothetical protein ING66_15885 [Rhodocyclaceae bacterium]|nr:hypothetical protein [Rhodocyclaceae bacterium]MCA3059891.1 hypothetical protein [Rhodocyclaceae bacterium]MCA3081252.1 hypothetical protein [Rhodocyclaceae bacterium]
MSRPRIRARGEHFEDVLEMVKKPYCDGNYREILGGCPSIRAGKQA